MVKIPQGSFARGELSPRMFGRDDTEVYYAGLKNCLNFVVTSTASIQRRSGTKTAAATKTGGPACLYSFEFSDTQAYIIEAGDQYLRFFSQNVPVFEGGAVFEVATPYTGTEFCELTTAQSTDTLYITHPDHPPYELKRTSATTFSFAPFQFDEPPMSPKNRDRSCTMTLSGGSAIPTQGQATFTGTPPTLAVGGTIAIDDGTGTLVYTTVTGLGPPVQTSYTGLSAIPATVNYSINGTSYAGTTLAVDGGFVGAASVLSASGCAPFTSSDIGRAFRMKVGTQWHTFNILGYISPTQVQTDYVGTGQSTAQPEWHFGAFTEGSYPTAVAFYQDRLVFAGTKQDPQAVWMSAPGAYGDFALQDRDGSTNDDNGILAVLNDYEVNPIYWLRPIGYQLLAATSSGITALGPSYDDNIIAPTTVRAEPQKATGSMDLEPIRARGTYVYAQAKGKKLISLLPPQYARDLYGSSELSVTAGHLPYCGIKDLAYQEEPYSIIWAATEHGELIACTYVPEERMTAWHRHRIGGRFDQEIGDFPKVASVQCVPSPDNDHDQLWLVVDRNGSHEIEYMQPFCGFPCPDEEILVFRDSLGSGALNSQDYQSYAEILHPNYDIGGASRGSKSRDAEATLHFYKTKLDGSNVSGSQYDAWFPAEWRYCEHPDKSDLVETDGILNVHLESGYRRHPTIRFETFADAHVEILKIDRDNTTGRS